MNINEELSAMIRRRYRGEQTVEGVIDYLVSSGILDKNRALKALVKDDFYHRIKTKQQSIRSATLDVAIRWDRSETFVKNCIYVYRNIKP